MTPPLTTEPRTRGALKAAGWLAGLSEHDEPVLVYIVAHVARFQRPPTMNEIRERFGWQSRTAALNRVKSLAAAGYVVTGDESGRAPIRVVGMHLAPSFARRPAAGAA
jgi:hypothetical protein